VNASTDPMELVLSRLQAQGRRVVKERAGFAAQCPAHDDGTPSLAVARAANGGVLLYCRAGCATDAVLSALGLSWPELCPPGGARFVSTPPARCQVGFDSAAAVARYLARRHGPCSRWWRYADAMGEPCGVVMRWDHITAAGVAKEVRPAWRIGTRWFARWPEGLRPLYRLPELGTARRVFVAEGEKCADALHAMGVCGTTSSGGAQQASRSWWPALSGREVFVLPDADAPGEKYAREVVALLGRCGARACVVELPGLEPDSGQDVADWLELRHGGDASAARAELDRLAAAARAGAQERPLPPSFATHRVGKGVAR
jgi:putative DNA primase/helicase